MTAIKLLQNCIVWNRGAETQQPPCAAELASCVLEPFTKGTILRVIMYFPEYDYGMHQRLEYLDDGLFVVAES